MKIANRQIQTYKTVAERTLDTLRQAYPTSNPVFLVVNNGDECNYHMPTGIITIGLSHGWFRYENIPIELAIYHEYAHHVYRTNGLHEPGTAHGDKFWDTLVVVLKSVNVDPCDYPWLYEYADGRRYAITNKYMAGVRGVGSMLAYQRRMMR